MNILERLQAPLQLEKLKKLSRQLSSSPAAGFKVSNIEGAGFDFFVSAIAANTRQDIIIVIDDRAKARRLAVNLRTLLGFFDNEETYISYLPYLDVEAYSKLEPHFNVTTGRIRTFYELGSDSTRKILITPSENLLFPVPSPGSVIEKSKTITTGQEIFREDLIADLLEAGYQRRGITEDMGEFSVRGGIVDFFSPLYRSPHRIEYEGDTITGIRYFDPSNQITIEKTESVIITPVTELCCGKIKIKDDSEEEKPGFFNYQQILPDFGYLLDYFDNAVIIHHDPMNEGKLLESMVEHFKTHYEAALKEGRTVSSYTDLLLSLEKLGNRLKKVNRVYINNDVGEKIEEDIDLSFRSLSLGQGRRSLDASMKSLLESSISGEYMTVFTGDVATALAMKSSPHIDYSKAIYLRIDGKKAVSEDRFLQNSPITSHFNIETAAQLTEETRLKPILIPLPFYGSIKLESINFAYLGSDDLAVPEKSKTTTKKRKSYKTDLRDLQPGNYLIHQDHGIGRYLGLKKIAREGTENEFLELEYEGGEKLYVPLERLDLIDKYLASEEIKPKLDRLGSTVWKKRKERVKKSVEDLARKLINLYASRELIKGFQFGKDTDDQAEFERTFPFEETEDQITAIEDVKNDLESNRPMDRLIVGDVGFGKTEIAIRAAFKAVRTGKQVAVLTPTTLLAFQHYRNFKERMKDYSIEVAMLSRLTHNLDRKPALEGIENGKVDIAIGTHRLLSEDIKFKNLGLLVIDEEQRFGVKHKEKLKFLKHNVDVLTLTATPIPRTLYLSMAGIRDLSLIQTPPANRLSIKTELIGFDDSIIREAINREVSRGGQVFFLHNRVSTIYDFKAKIQEIVPGVKIAVAHGQMNERELENIILDFIDGKADILLSTTIIENGIDIPNVNTLLVHNAHLFGLSQLYQIRGRVGRSERQAYCYLIVPAYKSLNTDARKRLQTLTEFSRLGAGFRIAAVDMEIRGSGNILGAEQSGHVNEVGFDLYTRMLEEAVQELKGIKHETAEIRTSIELYSDILISEDYIPDVNQRLTVYRKFATANSMERLEEVIKETTDMYGKMPKGLVNLIDYSKLRIIAGGHGISKIALSGKDLVLKLEKETSINPENLFKTVNSRPDSKFLPDGRLIIKNIDRTSAVRSCFTVLEELII
ncbi:MAG: transcription-repair coupling factor [Acidobacteria bacterium]|nr:transcription-repair coupling factor [Acidobacteriota bacterium]